MQARTLHYTIATLALTALPTHALAEDTLTLSNGTQTITLNRDDLEELPQISFETTTIWSEGKMTFSGPSLHALIQEVGITDGTLNLTAANDYAIQIPVTEITEELPIVASLINGATFSRREKGPYWVVYPYDSGPEFRTELIYTRSIWQLTSIERDTTD